MQGILLLYLYRSIGEGGLAIDPGVAAGLVGAYGGGVYLSTMIGGWLADRVLVSERVLFYSAVIIMLGHIALAVVHELPGWRSGSSWSRSAREDSGASATAVVGSLYAPRRDAGFSLFYLVSTSAPSSARS